MYTRNGKALSIVLIDAIMTGNYAIRDELQVAPASSCCQRSSQHLTLKKRAVAHLSRCLDMNNKRYSQTCTKSLRHDLRMKANDDQVGRGQDWEELLDATIRRQYSSALTVHLESMKRLTQAFGRILEPLASALNPKSWPRAEQDATQPPRQTRSSLVANGIVSLNPSTAEGSDHGTGGGVPASTDEAKAESAPAINGACHACVPAMYIYVKDQVKLF